MKELPLITGETALVSDEDHEWLSRYRWTLEGTLSGVVRRTGSRSGERHTVWMAREVLGLPRKVTDSDRRRVRYLNGNFLDCRRENLAVYSYSAELQSRQRRSPDPESRLGSRYIGVRKNRYGGKFSVVIRIGGRQKYLGSYATEEEAALVYDCHARKIHGPHARVNFAAED